MQKYSFEYRYFVPIEFVHLPLQTANDPLQIFSCVLLSEQKVFQIDLRYFFNNGKIWGEKLKGESELVVIDLKHCPFNQAVSTMESKLLLLPLVWCPVLTSKIFIWWEFNFLHVLEFLDDQASHIGLPIWPLPYSKPHLFIHTILHRRSWHQVTVVHYFSRPPNMETFSFIIFIFTPYKVMQYTLSLLNKWIKF